MCYIYIYIYIYIYKWFCWIIQFWVNTSNTGWIRGSMSYSVNMIRPLVYLSKKILNLATSSGLFLIPLVSFYTAYEFVDLSFFIKNTYEFVDLSFFIKNKFLQSLIDITGWILNILTGWIFVQGIKMQSLVNEYRTIRKTRGNQANIETLQKMPFHLGVCYKITSLNQAILEIFLFSLYFWILLVSLFLYANCNTGFSCYSLFDILSVFLIYWFFISCLTF